MYTWDEVKDRINKEKHGFYFSEIVEVFEDPHLIEWYDKAHSIYEYYQLARSFRCAPFPRHCSGTFCQPWSHFLRK